MKYKLDFPFRSVSGVMERRIEHNGTRVTLIARKDGTMYWRHDNPRKRKSL